ncbi:hypothetical protein OUZ56_019266 [Daphnia magna]|uniref:Uncharacterized protein n=1 Tax=Daphnia magna TaxID=35525 RepID=A0ABQ9ZBR2_9CRUS|nr:hypothetical protein OUZ56_019266 [Daphnia magna]
MMKFFGKSHRTTVVLDDRVLTFSFQTAPDLWRALPLVVQLLTKSNLILPVSPTRQSGLQLTCKYSKL